MSEDTNSGVARVHFMEGHTGGHLLFLGGHTYHMMMKSFCHEVSVGGHLGGHRP